MICDGRPPNGLAHDDAARAPFRIPMRINENRLFQLIAFAAVHGREAIANWDVMQPMPAVAAQNCWLIIYSFVFAIVSRHKSFINLCPAFESTRTMCVSHKCWILPAVKKVYMRILNIVYWIGVGIGWAIHSFASKEIYTNIHRTFYFGLKNKMESKYTLIVVIEFSGAQKMIKFNCTYNL